MVADERVPLPRVEPGLEYLRFDSLRLLVKHCRAVYAPSEVVVDNGSGELRVRVTRSDGSNFSILVMHLEGERTYLVRLP